MRKTAEISSLLGVRPGVTALIGGGGKTTLLYTLADELRVQGSVVLCTSTHIRRPDAYPVLTTGEAARIRSALSRWGVVCCGIPSPEGKLAAPVVSFSSLANLADYVLVEADGSRGLPLKAHASHEPVIPANAGRVVLVLGADGLGKPIREACHRPELYARLAEASPDDSVTPDRAARVIDAEGLGDILFINKAEDDTTRRSARALVKLLSRPAVMGSLYGGEFECLC